MYVRAQGPNRLSQDILLHNELPTAIVANRAFHISPLSALGRGGRTRRKRHRNHRPVRQKVATLYLQYSTAVGNARADITCL